MTGRASDSAARGRIEERVAREAEAALAERRAVSAVDVLLGLRWLTLAHVDRWRQGRIESLEQALSVRPDKLEMALSAFQRWAERRGLSATETTPVARTRDRRLLRFTVGGDPEAERLYRTDWVDPALSPRQRDQVAERRSRPPDLVVVSPLRDWTCVSCGGTGGLLMMEDAGPLCTRCVEMELAVGAAHLLDASCLFDEPELPVQGDRDLVVAR